MREIMASKDSSRDAAPWGACASILELTVNVVELSYLGHEVFCVP